MALLPSPLLHAQAEADELSCPICFGTMLQPRALPGCTARHVFCAPCITLWFELCGSQRTCPIDRRALPTDEEPTSEQFAAFAYIIDNNLPPYVDFGVFGPYNGRFQLQQKFVTHRWTADGKWLPVQLKGPKNHDEWLKSWKVYETLCIMKDVASLATLRQVETKIRKLNDRFGIDHWGFIWEAYDHGMKEQLAERQQDATNSRFLGGDISAVENGLLFPEGGMRP